MHMKNLFLKGENNMNDKKDEVVKEIEIKVGRLENLTKIKKLYIIMCIYIL